MLNARHYDYVLALFYKSEDPDQLASEKPSDQDLHFFFQIVNSMEVICIIIKVTSLRKLSC